MVENIDMNVGRILQALKESGEEEETIVIFLSDNGPNGQRYKGGLKGIKASLDEGGWYGHPFLSGTRQVE